MLCYATLWVCSREISKGLKDLLKGLLERKVADRIGSREDDAQELLQSEFLSSLDMERVLNKEYPPEFVPPEQRHDTDVRNFEREFTDERVRVHFCVVCYVLCLVCRVLCDGACSNDMISTREEHTIILGLLIDLIVFDV